MLRTFVARTTQELAKLRERWEFCATQGSGSIFQTFLWVNLAAAIFAVTESPVVVAAESDAGLALIPAVLIGGGSALGLIGEALFDYRDVLHVGDPSVLRAAWNELAGLGLPLEFTALRGGVSESAWDGFDLEPFVGAPLVPRSQISAEQFLSSHSRLGRQVRRLAKRGATLRRYDGTASELIRWIYDQKGEQPQGNIFSEPARREFMVRVALGDPKACDVFTYETDTDVVAALVTFRYRQMRHFYTIYFDQGWAHLSPGQVLAYEVTGLTLAEGLDGDYMTGEHPYKMRLATSSVPLYKVSASAERIAQVAAGAVRPSEIAA